MFAYTVVAPAANRLLQARFCPVRTRPLTGSLLDELREKQLVDDAVCLVDGAP